ncbi:hypothetical protein ACFX13_029931 [Malus domestica]
MDINAEKGVVLVAYNFGFLDSPQALMTVMGALYAACLFLGVNNASSVQPIVSIERTVFYRQKAAGMYSPLAYAAAQGLVEIPYIAVQTIVYGVITYFMYYFLNSQVNTATRNSNSVWLCVVGMFLLYIVFMFLTFTYFTLYGMAAVGVTSSQHLAAVVSSTFYSLWNLLSGFLVPKPVSNMLTIAAYLVHYSMSRPLFQKNQSFYSLTNLWFL